MKITQHATYTLTLSHEEARKIIQSVKETNETLRARGGNDIPEPLDDLRILLEESTGIITATLDI